MPLFLTFVVLLVLVFLLWLVSLMRRDVSIMDIFWGCGFVVVAWLGYFNASGFAPRKILLTWLVTIWGLRLAVYLFWRNHGQGEDYRYLAMRKRNKNFALLSLPIVFLFQGVLIWLISWPLQFAHTRRDELTPFDFLGTLLWVIGLLFETVGDWQLARFKADPNNRGKVLDRGLWRYTRHPNYFGDTLLWWGFFCFALPNGWWTVVSPLVMTTLLLKISGVELLEKALTKTKPQYADYVRRTNAFLPWFPRKI